MEFVDSIQQLPGVVAAVGRKTNTLVLVEKYLGGREYCIAVMGAGPAGALAFSPVERHLDQDERVFTSMDVKAITADRVRAMDLDREREVVGRLQQLASDVYTCFNLTSLVRLDIRADEAGELYILVSCCTVRSMHCGGSLPAAKSVQAYAAADALLPGIISCKAYSACCAHSGPCV